MCWELPTVFVGPATDLRMELIRQRLGVAQFALELQARRHLAVFAVALAFGGASGWSGLTGDVAGFPALAATIGAAAVVMSQVAALGGLGRRWQRESEAAERATQTLMLQESAQVHDDEGVDP